MTDLFDATFFAPGVELSELTASEREPYSESAREWLPTLKRVTAGFVAASAFVVAVATAATQLAIVPRAIVVSDGARPPRSAEPDRIYAVPSDTEGLARFLLKTKPLERLDDLV